MGHPGSAAHYERRAAPRPGHETPHSILKSARVSVGLDVASPFFALEAALPRAGRRFGGTARGGAFHRLGEQRNQTFDRISAVALLGSKALRLNHDHAVLGHALAGEPF